MARNNRPIPPAEHLIELFNAAVSNARSLLADAELLMDAESLQRAHALAVFAAEELGKAKLCMMALAAPRGPSGTPQAFWNEFYSHEGKLLRELGAQSLLMDEPSSVQEAVMRLPGASQSVHTRKVRGLFVDYQNGVILVPGDIDRPTTQEMIDDVRASLSVVERVLASEGAQEQLRELGGAGQEQFYRQAVNLIAPDVDTAGWDSDRLYQEVIRLAETDPSHLLRALHELWSDFRPPADQPRT